MVEYFKWAFFIVSTWVALYTFWEAFAPWLIRFLSPEQGDTQLD